MKTRECCKYVSAGVIFHVRQAPTHNIPSVRIQVESLGPVDVLECVRSHFAANYPPAAGLTLFVVRRAVTVYVVRRIALATDAVAPQCGQAEHQIAYILHNANANENLLLHFIC